MSPTATWIVIISSTLAVGSFLIALDYWIDSKPGGRKRDAHLEHLREAERYRRALERIHAHQDADHVRIGRKDRP